MTEREKIRRHLTEAGKLDQGARIAYWQKLGTAAIFNAANELVLKHCEENGIDPKFDRTTGYYQRGPLPKEK